MRSWWFDWFLYLAFLLFLLLFPLVLSINFMQSDDWVYYTMVENLIFGDYRLHVLSPSTFYSQGLLGVAYATVAPLSNLPVLTLLASVTGFYVFARILFDNYYIDVVTIGIFAFLMFLNPLHVYSTFSFMTEIYMMLALLMMFYFFHSLELYDQISDFIFLNISLVIGFFVRQITLVSALALAIYYIFKKKYYYALVEAVLFIVTVLVYYLKFPQTIEMYSRKSVLLDNLTNVGATLNTIVAIFILLGAFLFPLVLREFYAIVQEKSIKRLLQTVVVIFLVYLVFDRFFIYSTSYSSIFPHFNDVFTSTGFIPTSIQGGKYSSSLILYLFSFWGHFGLLGAGVLITHLVRKFKQEEIINFFVIFIVVYISTLVLLPKVYDRYLLPLIPALIILFVQTYKDYNWSFKFISIAYLVFLTFIGYQFTMDYVRLNNASWALAAEIVTKKGVPLQSVSVNSAWDTKFGIKDPTFIVSLDKPVDMRKTYSNVILYDSVRIKFPLNYFEKPILYVYQRPSVLYKIDDLSLIIK